MLLPLASSYLCYILNHRAQKNYPGNTVFFISGSSLKISILSTRKLHLDKMATGTYALKPIERRSCVSQAFEYFDGKP